MGMMGTLADTVEQMLAAADPRVVAEQQRRAMLRASDRLLDCLERCNLRGDVEVPAVVWASLVRLAMLAGWEEMSPPRSVQECLDWLLAHQGLLFRGPVGEEAVDEG
jgi:hypothetical protein